MSTWNGIGTKFYGSKDQWEDESFITTEWFVVLGFPVLPVRSVRVMYMGTTHGWRRTTSQYSIIQKRPLDWGQVFFIYFVASITLFVAYWSSILASDFFAPNNDWYGIALAGGFILPIALSIHFFLEAKPSKKHPQRIRPGSRKNSVSNLLSKASKPTITPPPSLDKPDLDLLEPIIQKYQPHLNRIMGGNTIPEWLYVKKTFDDLIFLNLQTISHFMDNEVYEHDNRKKKGLEEQIKTATTMSVSCAWMIGKEWSRKDSSLRQNLRNKNRIELKDVPKDALFLLEKAILPPYSVVSIFFNEYYNSSYGKHLSYQQEGHLTDM